MILYDKLDLLVDTDPLQLRDIAECLIAILDDIATCSSLDEWELKTKAQLGLHDIEKML